MLELLVFNSWFNQTVEQKKSLLKIKEFISRSAVFLSNRCFILFICMSLCKQLETVFVTDVIIVS